MNENKYNLQRYNRKKNKYRILFGLYQMKTYPWLNVLWILLAVGIAFLCKGKKILAENFNTWDLLANIFNISMTIALALVTVILVIGVLQAVGYLFAIKDESLIAKVFGNNRDYMNEPPILIKKNKKNDITTREFYTTISMKEWEKKLDDICDKLDIHIIGNIEYGGKKHNTGYLRTFDSKEGRIPNNSTIYDYELVKDLEG